MMPIDAIGVYQLGCLVGSAGISALMVWMMIRHAQDLRLLDEPNDRSAHDKPTPRGGGIGFVAASSLCVPLVLASISALNVIWLVTYFLAIAIALLGLLDDLLDLRPSVRLVFQLMSALAFAGALASKRPEFQDAVGIEILALMIVVFGVTWSLNLFNFMDGIDGIAATEFLTICLSVLVLAWIKADPVWLLLALVSAAAMLPFLFFNWSPARIFMGDVGSGYIGFLLGCWVTVSAVTGFADPVFWLIIYAGFLCDSGVTLLRRILRGVNPMRAHSEHAYQQLARRIGSHSKVSIDLFLLNVVWLLPWAILSQRVAALGGKILVLLVAVAPVVFLVGTLGAGRPRSDP